MKKITPFLLFEGNAEAVINTYSTIFKDFEILNVEKYAENQGGKVGSIRLATFAINGQQIQCTDSPIKHNFNFTPSISFFLNFNDEAEIDSVYGKLVTDGKTLMEMGEYGIGKKFGWIEDKFGISWQLQLD